MRMITRMVATIGIERICTASFVILLYGPLSPDSQGTACVACLHHLIEGIFQMHACRDCLFLSISGPVQRVAKNWSLLRRQAGYRWLPKHPCLASARDQSGRAIIIRQKYAHLRSDSSVFR